MGMNKVLVCNRNGYGIELFCFFSISNSAHNRIEIFDSIVNSNRLGGPLPVFISLELGAVAESCPCPKTGRRGKGSSLGINNDV